MRRLADGTGDRRDAGDAVDASPRARNGARRRWSLTAAAGSGLALALALPPAGLWPLGPVGIGILGRLLHGRGARQRVVVGATAGLAYFAVGLWWVADFTLPGYVVLCLLEAGFMALACLAVPSGTGWAVGVPAALVLMEAARTRWPLGGLPLAGLSLGQANGPFAPAAAVGGPLAVVLLVGVAGAALGALTRPGGRPVAAAAVAVLAGTAALAPAAPAGRTTGDLAVAAVQGGGPRGVRALDSDPGEVFRRHLESTDRIQAPVDVVLWPEDVVDVPGPVALTSEGRQLAGLAQRLRTTLVVGVVEDAPKRRFRNAVVAWGPDGREVARYDKVHRVPFGEYVPARGLVRRFADLAAVPRDAIPGRGPGLLDTPAGPLGVLISYEVFFPDRARVAVRSGADVLLVPTNASSYQGRQVPAMELAAARLRALETGRSVVQATPTGYSAIVSASGTVQRRSPLGPAAVLDAVVPRRQGNTIYTRVGDGPILLLSLIGLTYAWAIRRTEAARSNRRSLHQLVRVNGKRRRPAA